MGQSCGLPYSDLSLAVTDRRLECKGLCPSRTVSWSSAHRDYRPDSQHVTDRTLVE